MLVLGTVACTEKVSTKKEPVLQPIKSVIAMDGKKEVTAKIDHAAKTINFAAFENVDDMTAVEVKIEVAEGATLVSPEAVATLDLSKAVKVVVNNNVRDLEYVMTAEKPVLNPIKEAGFSITDQFGALPEHIKIYSNKKLGTAKNVEGFIIELSEGAEFAVYGNGNWMDKDNNKDIASWVKAQPGWSVYVNGLCGYKEAVVNNGKLVYSRFEPFPVFAVEKDGKYICCPQIHEKDDAGKELPTIAKLDIQGNVIQKAWMPQYAQGGYYMVISEGNELNAEQMAKTGAYGDGWWKDDATSGREFIGVNKDGSKAFIYVNGKASDGISMKEAVKIMKAIGSYNAMTMEGSSSAMFYVGSKKGIEGNDSVKLTASVLAIK